MMTDLALDTELKFLSKLRVCGGSANSQANPPSLCTPLSLAHSRSIVHTKKKKKKKKKTLR
eukprot:NODE_1941_length_407_cov_244.975000_g1931_i0.p3 GENE.NODE_1941_length_407_cov_244.975000_g1931_i0~~NODE_1941_length_407_cov_244.975000_g1931_i0.p3  ORF type:complete len:61 (+),score=24.53 NODE_1941_length_407_cov_244.975000_g1931_i0:222-404(+)